MLPQRQVVGLRDIGFTEDIPEEGDTLEENAIAKAMYLFQKTGKPSLAEDTGLEVDALNGKPGVKTARYAGEERDMEKNIAKILLELEDKPDRSAQFRTIIALVTEDGTWTFEGLVRGTIAKLPEGSGGFGYDPVFIPDTYDQSFAMLPAETKNAISHRGRAVAQLLNFLENSGEKMLNF